MKRTNERSAIGQYEIRRPSAGGAERGELLFEVGALERGDERIESAFHHLWEAVQREAHAVVGHAALRKVVGADALAAVAGADLAPTLRGVAGARGLLLLLEQAGAEDGERAGFVLLPFWSDCRTP